VPNSLSQQGRRDGLGPPFAPGKKMGSHKRKGPYSTFIIQSKKRFRSEEGRRGFLQLPSMGKRQTAINHDREDQKADQKTAGINPGALVPFS